jgi:hypothetical protein
VGRAVGLAARDIFAGWFAPPARPLVRAAISGLLDERVRQSFGFPASRVVGRLTTAALRLRAVAVRLLPKRRRPLLRTALAHRSYPNGWRLDELGPPRTKLKPGVDQ